eukprot:10220149-Ditylum_brightwellii.AAC.1
MDKGVGRLIVGLYPCWLLGVSHGFKDIAETHHCLAVVEQRSTLCIRCRSHNMLECSTLDKNGDIVRRFVVVKIVWVGCAVEIADNAAFGAIDDKICSIGVNMQLHVASKKVEHCIWICC